MSNYNWSQMDLTKIDYLLARNLIRRASVACLFMASLAASAQPSTNGVIVMESDPAGTINHDGFMLFWKIIWIVAGFGAFGGLLASMDLPFKEVRETRVACYGSFRVIFACTVQGILWGAGGALTFATVAALLDKLIPFNVRTLLFMSFSSVAAGFLGIKMVRLVAGYLENLAKRTFEDKFRDETQKVAENAAKKETSKEQMKREIDDIVHEARSALNIQPDDPAYFPSLRQAMSKLEATKKNNLTDRKISIALGRILRRFERLDDAIVELRTTYDERRIEGVPEDKDDAALLYNLACYQNVEAEKLEREGDHKTSALRRKAAGEDIQKSIELDPLNSEEAKNDIDLKGLI